MEESSGLLPRTCAGLCLGVHYAHSTEPDIWPDGCLEEAQDLLLSDLSHVSPLPPSLSPPFRLLPAFEAPPPRRLPVPIRELPPRRKVVWIWICVRAQSIIAYRPCRCQYIHTLTIPQVLLWPWWHESQCRSLSPLRYSSLSNLPHPTVQYPGL